MNVEIAKELQVFIVKNKERFAPYEPARDDYYYTLEGVKERINSTVMEQNASKSVSLVVTMEDSQEIIAVINFTNFVFGVFQACYVGFSIDQDYEGQGIMTEVLPLALMFIKQHYNIHRVMANYLPCNERSKKLLQRIGFVEEGYAKSYLKINGQWQDHVLNSFIFD